MIRGLIFAGLVGAAGYAVGRQLTKRQREIVGEAPERVQIPDAARIARNLRDAFRRAGPMLQLLDERGADGEYSLSDFRDIAAEGYRLTQSQPARTRTTGARITVL